jgi:hypothetical protein
MRRRAGRCLATVRLLMMSIAVHALSGLAATGSHILAADGARDRDPRLHGLVRTSARLDEELRAVLPRHCLQYIFADLPRSSYRLLMWSVAKVEAINSVGLDRFLQYAPELAPLGACNISTHCKSCKLAFLYFRSILCSYYCTRQLFACLFACGSSWIAFCRIIFKLEA